MSEWTNERIAEQRKVCDAATEGPWEFCACAGRADWPIVVAPGFGVVFNTGIGGALPPDCKFTAAARANYPSALTALQAAQARAEKAEAVVNGLERAVKAWEAGKLVAFGTLGTTRAVHEDTVNVWRTALAAYRQETRP